MIIQHEGQQISSLLVCADGDRSLFKTRRGFFLSVQAGTPVGDGEFLLPVSEGRYVTQKAAENFIRDVGGAMLY